MQNEEYEVAYAEGFDDLLIELKFPDKRILLIKGKIDNLSKHKNPTMITERVMNSPFRKIPLSNYRIFIHIDDNMHVIYVLSVQHHNKCYKKKELKKMLTLLRNALD